MYKIILNMFKNKTYLSALIFTLLLLFLIIIFKNSIFIPLFKQDLIDNTSREATKVSKHISRMIDFSRADTRYIDSEVKIFLKEFEIDKFNYYSKDGKILYSSKEASIGNFIRDEHFQNIVAKGKVYSSVNNEKASATLLEVYIPLMKGNLFTGAFEFYYDITKNINTFEKNIQKVNLYVLIFNSIFFIIIFCLLYFASKNNLRDIKYQNELENFKNIIDETKAYIFTKDTNGCYTFANKLVLKLFKVPLDELIGKDDSYFFDLKVSNELKINDKLVMEKGQFIEKEEINVVKETGDTNIYWSVKRPLYDLNGNIIGMSGISTDITHRKSLENEIKEQKKLLDIILNNVDAYIYIKDINRNFRYVNANTAELFGKSSEEIIGYKDSDVLPKEMADIFWKSDKDVFSKNTKVSIEESIVDPKGETKHYWSIKLPYILNEERVLIGFSSDITEIYNLKEKLKKEIITDSLTGLYNKRHFEHVAETEFKRSIRQNINMSIVIFDIDYFKQINDTYGHHTGDLILREASEIFKSLIREEDTLFRVGGEEFTIIFSHTNEIKTLELAERIRTSIEKKVFESIEKNKISITISFGISSLIKSDTKFEDILMRADKALYKAKNSGRNKTIIS